VQDDSPSFWRTEDPVVDDDGLVAKGGMWPHQRRWWQLKNFCKLLVTGYGGGKTWNLCKRLVSGCLLNTPAASAVVSPTFPMARLTLIPTMQQLLDGRKSLDPENFDWELNKSTHTYSIRYKNRTGMVHVLSGQDPDRLKGSNLGQAGIDEPFIQDYGVLKQMLARVRHPNAQLLEILLAGTPEQLNWGYQLAEGELGLDVGMVRASSKDNLALPKQYVDRLLSSYSDKEADAYVKGLFVNLSTGLVYHAFDPGANVVDLAMPDGAELFAGMDFNVNPMAFMVGWRHQKHMHVFAEYELPNSDTPEACQKLAAKHPGLRLIYPDPSGRSRHTNAPGGKTDFYYIEKAGFTPLAPRKAYSRRDSINAVNGALKHGRLTIAPNCTMLKRYLSTYAWELMTKQENQSHLLDALRYAVQQVMPVFKTTAVVTTVRGT
jgi:hypothetical protein